MKRPAATGVLVALLFAGGAVRASAQQTSGPRIDIRIERADLSFRELQRLVPALDRVDLPDDVEVERLQARGPLTAMAIDLLVRGRDSRIEGTVTGNLLGPRRTVEGGLVFDRVNLARLVDRPALPTHLTGRAEFDLAIDPAGQRPAITGPYSFEGARLDVAGYRARALRVRGRLDGDTVRIARAEARAYGARLTAEGRVGLPLGESPTTYQLTGTAANVDLRRLPERAPGPSPDTNLDLRFELADHGGGLSGRVHLDRSTVAGAILLPGTVATFETRGERLTYTAGGEVRGLDPQQMGAAFGLDALSGPRFAGEPNATFSVDGRGAELQPLKLTLTESRLFGGTIEQMNATLWWSGEQLRFQVAGPFDGVQPGRVVEDPALDGRITGSLDVAGTLDQPGGGFEWGDLALKGTVRLTAGSLEGAAIESLELNAGYAGLVLQLDRLLDVDGPDLVVEANGVLSFDPAVPSALTYSVNTPRIGALDELIGADVQGQLRVNGKAAGTDVLRTAGTLAGTEIRYGDIAATTVTADYEMAVPLETPAAVAGNASVEATFVRVAGRTLTEAAVTAEYADRRVGFDGRVQEADRTVTAAGQLVLDEGRQDVTLTAFRFVAPGTQWSLPPQREARLSYGGERIAVRDLRLESAGGAVIVADGALGLTSAEGPIDVRVEGLALSSIDTLVFGEQRIAGRLDASASVRGPLRRPDVSATFAIENGAIRDLRYASLPGRSRPATTDMRSPAV